MYLIFMRYMNSFSKNNYYCLPEGVGWGARTVFGKKKKKYVKLLFEFSQGGSGPPPLSFQPLPLNPRMQTKGLRIAGSSYVFKKRSGVISVFCLSSSLFYHIDFFLHFKRPNRWFEILVWCILILRQNMLWSV